MVTTLALLCSFVFPVTQQAFAVTVWVRLTDEEEEIVRRHTLHGILEVTFPFNTTGLTQEQIMGVLDQPTDVFIMDHIINE
jgi:hypothetical protein